MAEHTDTATPLTLTVPSTMKNLIEALVFASSEPVTALQLKTMVEETATPTEHRVLEASEIERTIDALNADYTDSSRPYRIIPVAGGYQFATLPEYAAWISRLYRDRMRRKLSQSALETLAIIAYKQPISKPEIEQIRGVNCDYVLKALLEKELVTITGRAETVGRPLLYGTTKEFLKHFGLNSITDLPRPREIEEILGESQFETERRMLEAQAAALAQQKVAEDFPSRLPHIPKRKPEIPEEVEIVTRKRVRQIRVRPVDDTETRELPFTAKEAEPTPELESVAAQEPVVPGPETMSADLPKEITRREEPVALLDTEPIPEKPSAPAPIASERPVPADAPEPDDERMERTAKPPLAATPVERTVPEEPAPTLWNSWKEKIQTFIRKLFG
ncbi:MAG: SMC-Scp complex subunit ScpB [Proteobacteria bacterium]|nr:SMC-Scp complex subunit ScpB [Pseudomonadota bacterium]